MDSNPPKVSSRSGNIPKLRPYQIPATEKKARDEKEAAERQEHINELRQEAEAADLGQPKRKHRFLRSVMHFFGWMLLIVVLTAIGGTAGWYFLLKPKVPTQTTAASSGSGKPQVADSPTTSTNSTTNTRHYKSPNFNLDIDYPEDWIVTDNNTKLTVASPVTSFKSHTITIQNEQTTLTIQNRQASTPAFTNGNAEAVRESEKIAYAKPSPTQRADSYISFLSYASAASSSTTTTAGLDGIYVTGDNGYRVGQAIPQVDIAKADPLITITFATCSDTKCGTGKPVTVNQSIWDDTSFSKPVKSMLQSLVVQ